MRTPYAFRGRLRRCHGRKYMYRRTGACNRAPLAYFSNISATRMLTRMRAEQRIGGQARRRGKGVGQCDALARREGGSAAHARWCRGLRWIARDGLQVSTAKAVRCGSDDRVCKAVLARVSATRSTAPSVSTVVNDPSAVAGESEQRCASCMHEQRRTSMCEQRARLSSALVSAVFVSAVFVSASVRV